MPYIKSTTTVTFLETKVAAAAAKLAKPVAAVAKALTAAAAAAAAAATAAIAAAVVAAVAAQQLQKHAFNQVYTCARSTRYIRARVQSGTYVCARAYLLGMGSFEA